MATRYVGPGGSNSNDGLTWATRKLTLNGVEAGVAAGDTVYVGPGVYRELLTLVGNGTSGARITYIADVTGEHTDGVGGIVRVTGSDDDLTATRANCVGGSKAYRTFRGFLFDLATQRVLDFAFCTEPVVEDCIVAYGSDVGIFLPAAAANNPVVRRSIVTGHLNHGIATVSGSTLNTGFYIENCIIEDCAFGVYIARSYGGTIKNCLIRNNASGVYCQFSLGGQAVAVQNNILYHNTKGMESNLSTDLAEDYNDFFRNGTDRTVTAVGANSIAVAPLFQFPILEKSIKIPAPFPGELAEWSTLRAKTGSSEATDDLYGLTRPVISAKKSWGPVQFNDVSQTTAVTYNTSPAALKMADAARVQFAVPVTPVPTTISCKVRRGASYVGALAPQLIIKQPGVADLIAADVGASNTWNSLSQSFTPSAGTDFVIVELVSNNEATSGDYNVYFDDLTVS